MEIIESKIYKDLDLGKYNLDENSCFLDIETTGLNRHKDKIYLIGVIYFDFDTNAWIINQIFAENLNEERKILLETIYLLRKHHTIINYNGSSFDIPFLNKKFEYHNINYFINENRSFDIYRIIRSDKMFLNLKNLKLKTIEKYLGIEREDIYSGGDCIQFYLDYVSNNDEILKSRIINHNSEDLCYMLDIIKILDILRDKKTFIVLDKKENYQFYIENINLKNNFLIVGGHINKNFHTSIMYYDINYSIKIEDKLFSISIETNKALVSPDKIGYFVYLNRYIKDIDKTLVLSVEKTFIIKNIKSLIQLLIEKSL